jgi:flagellar protein FliS
MSAAALRARYLGDQITTASPQRLLVMLYDRLALDLERAHSALTAGDREEASAQLMHAQEIVLELHASLRVDIWDGGPRLAAIYTWLHAELVKANIRGNARTVADCQRIVEPLREAWTEAAASLASSAE